MTYSSEDEPKCLVRVSDGKKNKFSTLILAKDTAKFHSDLNTLMRPQMLALKKHQKKRKGNQN